MNEEVKNKRKLKIVVIAICIILIIGIAGVGFARYITSLNGSTSDRIARWNFIVTDGNSQSIDIIDFEKTRTDNNQEVDSAAIAPGTYGVFELDVDARGTETALEYNIDIELTNKPQNLKFYRDENKTQEIWVNNNKMRFGKMLSLDDVKNVQPNRIWWSWELETGDTAEEIARNDLVDSQFIGQRMRNGNNCYR